MTSTEPTPPDVEDAGARAGDRRRRGGRRSPSSQELDRARSRPTPAARRRPTRCAPTSRICATSAAGARPEALAAFPAEPETVALYLVDHAERLAVSTLRRRLAAISEAHQAARLPNPTIDPAVRVTWAGIRRTHGKAPDAKEAAVTEVVAAMVAPLGRAPDRRARPGDPARGLRRRAAPLGAVGARRRRRRGDGGGAEDQRRRARRPTRRARATRSASPTARTRRRARCARGGRGSRPPSIDGGPAFRRLPHDRVTPDRIAGDGIARMVKRRAERGRLRAGAVQRPLVALGLRHDRGARRRGRAPDHAPGPLDARARRCADTSRRASCSSTTPRRSSGSEGRLVDLSF